MFRFACDMIIAQQKQTKKKLMIKTMFVSKQK